MGSNPITSFTKVTLDGDPATYLVIPQDPGLVGYWKFDEGSGTRASDSSGYNNHGTLYNFDYTSTSGWVDGKYGKALKFDRRRNNYVRVPNDPSLNPTTAITITAWIKPTRSFGGYIVSKLWEMDPSYCLRLTGQDNLSWVTYTPNRDDLNRTTALSRYSGITWQLLTIVRLSKESISKWS